MTIGDNGLRRCRFLFLRLDAVSQGWDARSTQQALRHVTLSTAADALRLVEEEIPIAGGGFRILVDRDDDGLDMLVIDKAGKASLPAIVSCATGD